jgi:hypothetical protein
VNNNKTIERQSAAKAVAEIFRGQGPLTDEEERQYKRLTEDVAEFNKRGRFKDLDSDNSEDSQETQKVEIEVSTDARSKSEDENEDEDGE